MNQNRSRFDAYAFSKQPGYDEPAVRRAFAKAVPLRKVVVYCYDPRAAKVPAAVAAEFGEVFPGTILRDEAGKKVASTATLFEVVVAGGRAFDALRSVTVAQHLFGIENIVIVHHTWCGATSFTADGIIEACRHEHGTDIGSLYPRDSICISSYETSLRHDVELTRASAGTPRHASIYGHLYDIDTEALTLVVEDAAAAPDRRASARVGSQHRRAEVSSSKRFSSTSRSRSRASPSTCSARTVSPTTAIGPRGKRIRG